MTFKLSHFSHEYLDNRIWRRCKDSLGELNISFGKWKAVEGGATCAIQKKGHGIRAVYSALSADRWAPHEPHIEFAAAGEVKQEENVIRVRRHGI